MPGIEPVSFDFRPASGAVPNAEDGASPIGPTHPSYGRRKTATVMSDARAPLI
ncbi:hypothetical protein BH10PSE6_BH10PSE6_27070 [soil metagenome]